MKNLIILIKIDLLTLKASYHHKVYMRLFNRYGGNHLANEATNGRAGKHRQKHNDIMDTLGTPDKRL